MGQVSFLRMEGVARRLQCPTKESGPSNDREQFPTILFLALLRGPPHTHTHTTVKWLHGQPEEGTERFARHQFKASRA